MASEDAHDDACALCERGGSLLCCDGCPRAFHAACLGLRRKAVEAMARWLCPYCESEADATATVAVVAIPVRAAEVAEDGEPAPNPPHTPHTPSSSGSNASRKRDAMPSRKPRKRPATDEGADPGDSDDDDDDFKDSPARPRGGSLPASAASSPSPAKKKRVWRAGTSPIAAAARSPTPARNTMPASEDADEDGDESECWVCQRRTPTRFPCTGCSRVFHAACLRVQPAQLRDVADSWVCPYCVRQRRGAELVPLDPTLKLPPAIRIVPITPAPSTRHLTPSQPRRTASAPATPATPATPVRAASSSSVSTPRLPTLSLPSPEPSRRATPAPAALAEVEAEPDRATAQPARRRTNGVSGPTSALTSFLAEKGISAQRIRQRHFERLAAETRGDTATPATEGASGGTNANADANADTTDPATLGRNLYAFPTVDNRPTSHQANRPRLRFEYVDEPVLDDPARRPESKSKGAGKADGKSKSKSKDKDKGKDKGKGRKRGADSSSSDDGEGDDANRWIAGFRMVRRRVAFCGQCDTRLPDGVLRCANCAKKDNETRRGSPAATTVSPSSRQRRTKGSEGSILNELHGRVLPLQEICMRYVCDNIDEVESFGDLDERARDRICQLVCHVRRLTNSTVKLFLDARAESLRLYDCAKLDRQGFVSMLPHLGALSTLTLKGCGRLDDDVFLQIPDAAPLLSDLTLDGAFLVSDHACALVISNLRLPLRRFCVANSARIGLGAVRALVARCAATLEKLKLEMCSNVDDEALRQLRVMERLDVLSLRACVQITDEGVFPLLQAIGAGLRKLNLRDAMRLRHALSGRAAEEAHTLPVASLQGRGATTQRNKLDDDDDDDDDDDGDAMGGRTGEDDGPRAQRLERQRQARLGKMKALAESDDLHATVVFARLDRGLIGAALTKLDVSATAFDDYALSHVLRLCSELGVLDLTRTRVTSDGVEMLAASPAAPKLTRLMLNALRNVSRQALERVAETCTALETLDVSWIRDVDDDLMNVFREKLVQLRRVYIWGCNRVTECGVGAPDAGKRFVGGRLAVVGSFFVI